MFYYRDSKLWDVFQEAIKEWSKSNVFEINYKWDENDKKFVEDCKNLAESIEAKPKENQFSSHFFVVFARHLDLQEKFEMKFSGQLKDLMYTIHAHLGNRYNYSLNKEIIKQILTNGIKFKPYKYMEDENIITIVEAAKRLSKISPGLTVKYGTFDMTNEFCQNIFQRIDNNVRQIGGFAFLEYIGDRFFTSQKCYVPLLDRYLLSRNATLYGRNKDGKRNEPIHFLIQMAGRHLKSKPLFTTLFTNNIQQILFKETVKFAEDFLDCLDQNIGAMEYAMMPEDKLIWYLFDDLLFHKLCVPAQYSSRFILSALDWLIKPFFQYANKKYNYHDYKKFAEYILNIKYGYTILTFEQIKNYTKISRYKLIEILKDISLSVQEINKEYSSFYEKTNFFDFPIINLGHNKYFVIDRHFSGISFLTKMKDVLKNDCTDIDLKQGFMLEDWLHYEMSKKKYGFKSGHYPKKNGLNESDCDLVCEKDNSIYFFELKKRQIMKAFDEVDDVRVISNLGSGMVRAQKQCFEHELYLNKNNYIEFDDGKRINYTKNKPIYKISICFGEHDYLTSNAYTKSLMGMVFTGDFLTYDETRQVELKEMKKYSTRLKDIAIQLNILNGVEKCELNQLTSFSSFCSFQQILFAIWCSKSESDFLDIIREWNIWVDGSNDPYKILLRKISFFNRN